MVDIFDLMTIVLYNYCEFKASFNVASNNKKALIKDTIGVVKMTKIKITKPINTIKSFLIKRKIKKILSPQESSYKSVLFISSEMKLIHPDFVSHY